MKRQRYSATVSGETRYTFAWNSAIRASEAMVREIARAAGTIYSGGDPIVTTGTDLRVYTRRWSSDRGGTVVAEIRAA